MNPLIIFILVALLTCSCSTLALAFIWSACILAARADTVMENMQRREK